jgi:hypothetical protein
MPPVWPPALDRCYPKSAMRVAAEAAKTAIASERSNRRYLFNDGIKASTMMIS